MTPESVFLIFIFAAFVCIVGLAAYLVEDVLGITFGGDE